MDIEVWVWDGTNLQNQTDSAAPNVPDDRGATVSSARATSPSSTRSMMLSPACAHVAVDSGQAHFGFGGTHLGLDPYVVATRTPASAGRTHKSALQRHRKLVCATRCELWPPFDPGGALLTTVVASLDPAVHGAYISESIRYQIRGKVGQSPRLRSLHSLVSSKTHPANLRLERRTHSLYRSIVSPRRLAIPPRPLSMPVQAAHGRQRCRLSHKG